ncbi:MAG: hypothetical protein M3137_14730 [Actinomycetota bacterium]|nr:hypothetical protein [Actinomycetota bacterium]
MFIQVITAKVVDEEAMWRQVARWESDVRPGAEGFLGSTAGITENGRLIVLARFESEEAALRNSERPEQGAWWAAMEKTVEDPTFQDSIEVVVTGGGGSDTAGFVQVMRGQVLDAAKLDELHGRMKELEAAMAELRPDVIGDVTVIHADGTFTDAVYFRSEAEARANEANEMPEEMQALFAEWTSAARVDEYVDLTQPRFT